MARSRKTQYIAGSYRFPFFNFELYSLFNKILIGA